MLEVSEVMRCVLLSMLEAVEGVLCSVGGRRRCARGARGAGGDAQCAALYAGSCGGQALLLEVPEVIRCVLLCILEAVEGELCLLEELEATLCMLLCMPEVVEGRLCSLEALEVMRCMLLRMLDAVEGGLGFRVSKFPLWQFSRYSPPPSTGD